MAADKKKKIIILGSNGILGSQLVQVFKSAKPIAWTINDLDITRLKDVESKIGELAPHILINAAAFTAVDECEEKRALAMKVNGEAVGYLTKICKKIGCILVHYSTDYVFRGDKQSGYKEGERTDPINVYGLSKERGEKLLKKYWKNFYLIRTSWLYGKNGRNFVDTMIDLCKKRVEVKVVNDQFGNPTYAKDLAERTKEIIDNKMPFGIYHLTNEGTVSWYKFAKEICRIKRFKTKIVPVTSYEFPRPAQRPRYSILVNTKIKKGRPWLKALSEYLKS